MTKGGNHNRQPVTPGSQPFQSMISIESSFWIERAHELTSECGTKCTANFGRLEVIDFKSGRRGSNPRRPAWESEVRLNKEQMRSTACVLSISIHGVSVT